MKVDCSKEEVDKINEILGEKAKKVRNKIDNFKYEEAKKILINEVLPIVPNHPVVLEDLSFLECKLKNYDKAYKYGIKALENSNGEVNPSLYDNLAVIFLELNRYEESRYYGKLALKLKKEKANEKCKIIYPLPKGKAPGLSEDKNKNIISYSLYGKNPRYCETAVSTTELASKIYPEWTCRFYVDESVPSHVITRLKERGAQVIFVNDEEKKISGLFWRFFVVDDPEVQCFIIRDADSLLSFKERAAVDEWLNSGKWFHIMRDANIHTELILAGMWGGYTGIFKDIRKSSQDFFDKLPILNKTIDQVYLRELVWPTVNQDVLIHDNRMLDEESKCYPEYKISEIEQIPYFHIGMIDAGLNTVFVKLKEEKKVDDVLEWYLVDENKNIICSYEGIVVEDIEKGKILRINLPYFYSQNIKNNKWEIYVKENNI